MKRASFFSLALTLALVAFGCANSKKENENNGGDNNIQNNHSGPCSSYCPTNMVCAGFSDEHSTCVKPCPCDENHYCYQGGCVDLFHDPNNCGGGGAYCAGECQNGQCVDACAARGTPCNTDQECCEANGIHTCVNTNTDMYNCGVCGNSCDPNEANACISGQCACGSSAACTNGKKCCGTECKDTNTDLNNCGECGNSCGVGLSCANGSCMCGGTACNPGESCCSNYCANFQTDPENCGECNNDCGDGNACVSGECGCGTSGQVCRSIPAGQPGCEMNMAGVCVQECCNGSCAVTHVSNDSSTGFLLGGQASSEHCGECGNSCGTNTCCCGGGGCTCCAAGETCTPFGFCAPAK